MKPWVADSIVSFSVIDPADVQFGQAWRQDAAVPAQMDGS
jgi:hypothetical protein